MSKDKKEVENVRTNVQLKTRKANDWLAKNRRLIKILTLTVLAIIALTSAGIMISVILRNNNSDIQEQEEVISEEPETPEPTIHFSSSLADEISAYDLSDDDGVTRMLTIPIQCNMSARYYVVNKQMVNGTFPNESTAYDGLASNKFAEYGVANCRTELSIGYVLPDGYTIDFTKANEGDEAYLEQYPEEKRFVIWRLWDVFADKTLAATGKSTGNKIITIYDENENVVKRYEIMFLPILHDEDKAFFDEWENQLMYGGSKTLKPDTVKSYSNIHDEKDY